MNLRERIENYLWKTFYQRTYPITARDILRATKYLMRLFREAKKEEKMKGGENNA